MNLFVDTIVALATPAGESALGIIRVSGELSLQLLSDIFPHKKFPARKATLGAYYSRDGYILDECLVFYYPNGASFTGESMLELNIHGNPFIAQKMIEDLLLRGCRLAEAGEFTRRAFLNGKMDLTQAEAVVDIIRSRSDKALQMAQRQLSGRVGKRITSIVDDVLETTAQIEAYIDFPDEDLPREDADGPLKSLRRLIKDTEHLIATSHYSSMIHDGVKVVLAGRPNAGKSSLLNALVGEDRAIVSDVPGTTRDYVEDRILLGPYPLRIIDTAGLRVTEDEVEKLGVEKSYEQVLRADLYLYLIDISEEVNYAEIDSFLSQVKNKPGILVLNKSDLCDYLDDKLESYLDSLGVPRLCLSALTGDGIGRLRECMLSSLEQGLSIPSEDAVVVSARHADALALAKQGLVNAFDKLSSGEMTELVASDMRAVLDALGQIIGKIDNERVLDHLFGSFCIGK